MTHAENRLRGLACLGLAVLLPALAGCGSGGSKAPAADAGYQQQLRERLLDQLAELEARVDFEEDLPPLDSKAVETELAAVQAELEQLVAEGEQGEVLRRGLRVAIIGRPKIGRAHV